MTNLIEGAVEKGKSVVIIEDLVSTGSSSLKAFEALREAGCDVKGMAAIFTYEFKTAIDNFNKAKCELITLSNYSTLIKQAIESKYIDEKDIASLKEWREAPSKWGVNA